jgi:hypothetical protein
VWRTTGPEAVEQAIPIESVAQSVGMEAGLKQDGVHLRGRAMKRTGRRQSGRVVRLRATRGAQQQFVRRGEAGGEIVSVIQHADFTARQSRPVPAVGHLPAAERDPHFVVPSPSGCGTG